MKINIGGQKGKDKFPFGWSVVDCRSGADFKIDLNSESFPINNNAVEAIYTSHTLEHIFPDKIEHVLNECHRVLNVGGLIRIVVPDIDIAIKSYVKKRFDFLKSKKNPNKMDFLPSLPIYYLSSWFFSYKMEKQERVFQGHLNVFNKESIKYHLLKSGFRNIANRKYGDCSPIFRGCDFERYKKCSLYVEAVK